MKPLRFLVKFFVKLPSLIFIRGVVQGEPLEEFVSEGYWLLV